MSGQARRLRRHRYASPAVDECEYSRDEHEGRDGREGQATNDGTTEWRVLLTALAEGNINAPAGSFYAYEAAQRLGLGDAGGLRIGLAPYSDRGDVERLLEALAEFVGG